jgi:SAM-dependent methyltransferase
VFADAAACERFMGRWSRPLGPVLLDWAGVDGPARFVDVGSGTGNLAIAVADRWPECEVLGVDPSPGFVAHASRRVPGGGPVRFEQGSAMELPVESGWADATVAMLVLNFVPDPSVGVAEMRRITASDGIVAAAVWDYGDGMQMLRTFWDAALSVDPAGARGRDEAAMHLAGEGALARLWAGAGLREVVEETVTVPTAFASFEDYWEPFGDGVGPAGDYVRASAPGTVEALREELRRRFDDAAPSLTARARVVRGLA